MASSTMAEKTTVPLCVDLDGTVIKSDLVWESLVRLLRSNAAFVFLLPFWLFRGRAYLKKQIALRTDVAVENLPLCEGFMSFLRTQIGRRPVLLVTASDVRLAQKVGDRLGIFTEVLASDGRVNLRGRAKGAVLAGRFGPKGFDYAGNSSVDLPVWEVARKAIVVNASNGLETRARGCTAVDGVFDPAKPRWPALLQALRPHQWVKNLILFVPLITAHQIGDPSLLSIALLAFLAFCLCASGVYVLNDLLDLDADRQHATKKLRPFARGDLPLWAGLVLFPLLLMAGAILGLMISPGLMMVLGAYLALTTWYSWTLKGVALVDVFCLAGLYTLRLIAGHEATGVVYSSWLLIFSMFIFLSLALVKRFVEIHHARTINRAGLAGRGYFAGDKELVAALGSGSGYLAVLVLALYVNSAEVLELYRHPMLLLLVCPLLLFWISRVWLLAHRGQMHDDPVVFALKDRASYVVGALTLTVLWAATGQ